MLAGEGGFGQACPVQLQSPAPESTLERRVIWLVALVQLVNVLDFVMVMPLGRSFARALDFPESQLGLVGGSYTLAAAVAGLVSSRFVDRFDRKRALMVAMAGLVAATAAGGLANGLPAMMATRIVAGMFGGPATSISMAMVADVVPPERRGRAMGIVMASFSVASVLGIPAGLYAAELGSWRTPFFGVATLGVLVVAFVAYALPSMRLHLSGTRPAMTSTLDLVRRPEIATILVAVTVMALSVFMIVPYVRSFLQNNYAYPEDRIKYLYLIGGIGSFVVVRLAGPAVDRFGSTPVAALGTLLVATCLVVGFLPEAPIVPVMVVFVAFMCTASMRGVPVQALGSKLPAPHERAQYMSLQSAVMHLASSAGAIGASLIITTDDTGRLGHIHVVVVLAIALALTMPILLWRVERRVRARLAAAAAAAPIAA